MTTSYKISIRSTISLLATLLAVLLLSATFSPVTAQAKGNGGFKAPNALANGNGGFKAPNALANGNGGFKAPKKAPKIVKR